jgi:hypothetical protein
MLNLETGKPDFRLVGLFTFFWRQATFSTAPDHRFYLVAELIEKETGITPYLCNKFCLWMSAAGLLRYWVNRQRDSEKVARYYQLYLEVLDPIVDGFLPWPTQELVQAFQVREKTYKTKGRTALEIPYTDYAVARMYPYDRPPEYVNRRSAEGIIFAEKPTATELRAADGADVSPTWPTIVTLEREIPSVNRRLQYRMTRPVQTTSAEVKNDYPNLMFRD